MPRRTSFTSLMNQIARDAARRDKEVQRQNKAIQVAKQKAEREKIRQKALVEKEAKQRYIESRFEETDDLNKNLEETIAEFENILEYKLQIFNRWGVLIYESYDLKKGWDGYTEDGNLAPQGVYVWKVTGRYADGEYFNKVGDVTFLH